MKKIYIGRGSDCHIRIKDDTDKVSRRQAVLEVSPFGKMRIHDTSTNGTFVNGKKVEKPAGTPVKRGDKVDFAHVQELDWALVKDPYKMMKLAVGIFVLVLLGLAAYFFIFSDVLTKEEVKDDNQTEKVFTTDSIADDSTNDVEPAAPAAPASPRPAAKPKAPVAPRPSAPAIPDNKKNEPDKNGGLKLINEPGTPGLTPDRDGLRPESKQDLKPEQQRGKLSREKD